METIRHMMTPSKTLTLSEFYRSCGRYRILIRARICCISLILLLSSANGSISFGSVPSLIRRHNKRAFGQPHIVLNFLHIPKLATLKADTSLLPTCRYIFFVANQHFQLMKIQTLHNSSFRTLTESNLLSRP